MPNKVPAHPIYQAAFDAYKAAGFSLSAEDYHATRVALSARSLPEEAYPATIVEEKVITAGPDNSSVTLTIVRPSGSENETLPALIYLHGGGYVLGSFHSHEKLIKDVAVRAHVAVVYVDYSLSPEVRFPVAVEECYSSALWLHENASSIKVDSSKLAIGGDSAGGNLSAAVSIILNQRGHGDLLKGQILIYPVVDHVHDHYESYQLYGGGDYLLSHQDMDFFMEKYYGTTEVSKDVRSAPLLATLEDLKGAPRALVLTAECDVLRDQGEAYSRHLTNAGVDAVCVRLIGATHGFATVPVESPQYRQSLNLITNFLNKEAFGQ